MKKRIIKKNINRFITPHIKGLPATMYYATRIYEDTEQELVIQRQHVISNGKLKREGEFSFKCNNLLLNIRRTGELVKQIVKSHKHALLRIAPEVKGRRTYIRLITE